MSDRVALDWSDAYVAYDFGPQHPLKPVRVKLTVDLIEACGLTRAPNVSIVEPRAATRGELELVHNPSYIDAVERIPDDATSFGNYGHQIGTGDNPAFPHMHE